MITIAYLRLEHELARWRAIGRVPRLWWRDDGVREPSSALERLLALARNRPLSLSVVPDQPLIKLAAALARHPNVTIGQNGIDHVNRRPAGQPQSEFPLDASVSVMAQSIAYGRQKMHNSGLDPLFYTPAWNHLDQTLVEALAQVGFKCVSAWDSALVSLGSLRRLDGHVDLLRGEGDRQFRGRGRFYEDLRLQLARRRRANMMSLPIGLVTHHLDHDEAAWGFLAEFLAFAAAHCDLGAFSEMVVPVAPKSWANADQISSSATMIAF